MLVNIFHYYQLDNKLINIFVTFILWFVFRNRYMTHMLILRDVLNYMNKKRKIYISNLDELIDTRSKIFIGA